MSKEDRLLKEAIDSWVDELNLEIEKYKSDIIFCNREIKTLSKSLKLAEDRLKHHYDNL